MPHVLGKRGNLVFVLLVVGGLGSAALHPVGMTIAGGPNVKNRALGVGFFATGGMIGFALGPLAILYLVSRFGTDATPWLMVPGCCSASPCTSCSDLGAARSGDARARARACA